MGKGKKKSKSTNEKSEKVKQCDMSVQPEATTSEFEEKQKNFNAREKSYQSDSKKDNVFMSSGSGQYSASNFNAQYRQNQQSKRNQPQESNEKQNKKFTSNSNKRSGYNSNQRKDKEDFKEYMSEFQSIRGDIIEVKTREITQDLFQMSEEYSLAHCVAEDMNMGSGIAVLFRHKFKRVSELLNQHQSTGGLAILEEKERFIYYLVTKKYSSGKPNYMTLFSSLKHLREHVVSHNVTKIAMPRIGCGLDRLEWPNVKFMLEFIFKHTDVEITICNLEPTEDLSPQKHKNCKVTHETYSIETIEKGTVIIYFSSEDEFISEDMKKLDEKFHFLNEFRNARKRKGDVIFYTRNENYLVCGCIVRKNSNDLFDFVAFSTCISTIQKENKKRGRHYYYAFEAFEDKNDSCVNYKIINLLRNNLRDAEVYVCWPKDLINEMSSRDRFDEDRDSRSGNQTEGFWSSKNDNFSRNRSPQMKTFKSNFNSNWRENDRNFYYENQKTDDQVERKEEPSIDWFEKGNTIAFVCAASEAACKSPLSASTQEQLPVEETNSAVNKEVDTPEYVEIESAINVQFEKWQQSYKSIDCNSIKENSLDSLNYYSRVCFASEDLMIKGTIPNGEPSVGSVVGKLLEPYARVGELASVPLGKNFLYCLIISGPDSSPTLQSVFHAIHSLKQHISKNNVKHLVIPNIEFSENNLTWLQIKSMFQFLMGNLNIDIRAASFNTVSNFQSISKENGNNVKHLKSGLHQQTEKSVIIFLGSSDNQFPDEMESLTKKFRNLKRFYEEQEKNIGDVIAYREIENCVIYVCIVKNRFNDPINFEKLEKCFVNIKSQNENKEKFKKVVLQAVNDKDGLNNKIMTVLLHCFKNIEICICWPGILKSLMPKK